QAASLPKHEVQFDTSSCQCVVRFPNEELTLHFYESYQQALSTGVVSLDLRALGIEPASVAIVPQQTVSEVSGEVEVRARRPLNCRVRGETTVRVVTEDSDPLLVQVVNDSDQPIPIRE